MMCETKDPRVNKCYLISLAFPFALGKLFVNLRLGKRDQKTYPISLLKLFWL